jgi:hypothetical protein
MWRKIMTEKEQQIIDWFSNNGAVITPIIQDYNNAKLKLMEMEPVVFHDDIQKEFNDLVLTKIVNIITKDLAIPAEMVYNMIEDKKLFVDCLGRNLN